MLKKFIYTFFFNNIIVYFDFFIALCLFYSYRTVARVEVPKGETKYETDFLQKDSTDDRT